MDETTFDLFKQTTDVSMKIHDFHEQLAEHLKNQLWFKVHELEELDAAVSHWIQSPELKFPCFTNSMRNESYAFVNKNIHHGVSNESGVCGDTEPYQTQLDFLFNGLPYPPPERWDFTFIDLFAGIGGFRLAFQDAGGKCVFSSEWDKYAKKHMKQILGSTLMAISEK